MKILKNTTPKIFHYAVGETANLRDVDISNDNLEEFYFSTYLNYISMICKFFILLINRYLAIKQINIYSNTKKIRQIFDVRNKYSLYDEHGIAVVRRNIQWQFLDADVAYGNEVSMAMAVGLPESIKAGILNQRNVEFTPKPTVDEILRKVQSILGKTQNHELERAIEQIKNPVADELGDFVREV